MTDTKKFFHGSQIICAVCAALFAYSNADAAPVRRQAISRTPTTKTTTAPKPAATEQPIEFATDTYIDESTDTEIIENKSSQFDSVFEEIDTYASDDSTLAETIRAQRDALNAQSATSALNQKQSNALASNQNACDMGLRACMKSKCGNDYAKCKGDGDTIWGDKMDACRRDLDCTGEEYRLFSAEIKADRDMNARLANYQSIIDCGNNYNNCIVTQCGTDYSKCLGKSAGDAAINKCASIAKNCTQQDSGLASRTMNVFATLRQDAEKQIQKDEQRLYDLRDLMAQTCSRMGAMFDERSLDCVYTVEFYAGDNTLFASKKGYAGSVFSCTPDWFGIDVTTFKENAYRLTRAQTSASSAMMGSGIGMAAGAITSGAIDRAVDRTKAEKALKKAEKEHDKNFNNSDTDTKSTKGNDVKTTTPDNTDDDTDDQKENKTTKKTDKNHEPKTEKTSKTQKTQNQVKTETTKKVNNDIKQKSQQSNQQALNTTIKNTALQKPKTLGNLTPPSKPNNGGNDGGNNGGNDGGNDGDNK